VALLVFSLGAVISLHSTARRVSDPVSRVEARAGNRDLAGELTQLSTRLAKLQSSLLIAESLGREARDAVGLVGPAPPPAVPAGSAILPMGALAPELRSAYASLRLARARSLTLRREYGEVAAAMAQRSDSWASIPTVRPLYGAIVTSRYGLRRDPFNRHLAYHLGVDLLAPYGTPVRATAGGLVVRAGRASGYGQMVEIDHGNGLHTRYAHNSRLAVEEGIYVRRGQILAYVGSSGRASAPHLHFEVRLNGVPVNPEPYLLPDIAPATLTEATLAE
jgi:murein DD-endopeptidase MepM/ murein hydrolase activator NlpD